jgi:hypothetical protein
MKVNVLKSHIAIPFFLKRNSPDFIHHRRIEYYVLLYNSLFPFGNIPEGANPKKHNIRVYQGITLPTKKVEKKKIREKQEDFAFRVKIGEYEVEITGTHAEVTKTLENLPNLITTVHKAFENVKPKTVTTLTVKTEPPLKVKVEPKPAAQTYPKITSVANCENAVLRLLETDWGKWRPRTMEELNDAMKANEIKYTTHTLEGTLNKLTDKGMVRRWNTNTGFVYILAEEKTSSPGGETT